MVELSNPADSVRSFNFPCKIKDDVVMNLPPHTHTHNHTHTYLYLLLCLTLGVFPSEGTFLGPSNPDGVRN